MITKAQTWPHIRAFYAELSGKYGTAVGPMVHMLDWLAKEGLESELFAFTSMTDLVITDRPEIDWDHHRLRVSLDFTAGTVQFQYARHDGATERMTTFADQTGAIEALRQFLAYKFGIYRPPAERPNQAPEPTPHTGR